MTSDKNISYQWYEGDLECSFHTLAFLESKVEELKVSHIKPHGRKVISNAFPYSGDPNALKEIHSYLNDRILSGVEVFPLNNSGYPLDIPRKFNATEVVIIDPQISNVRIVDYKKQGTLNAKVYFRLEKLNTIKEPEKDEPIINPVSTGIDEPSNGSHKPGGCFRFFPGWILKPFGRSRTNVNVGGETTPGGCLTPGLNGGCMNPGIGSGCLNTLRFGCGGLISLLLLTGLITMFLRSCDSTTIVDSDLTEIETDEKKVDLAPWEIEENDSIKPTTKDTIVQTEFKTIVLPNVQFYTNSAELLPGSKENLNTIALYMFENPTVKGIITGHTDSIGEEDENQVLSLERAQSVMQYLLNYGIDQNRLSAEGKGESEPIASNEIIEGRLMNRRVEITFYN